MTVSSLSTIGSAFTDVLAGIETAARETGRSAGSVRLVAASKTVAPPTLEAALRAGHRCFGENRVGEATEKWPDLRARWPDVELHLIGGLQSNKARAAVATFDLIQSVDRPSLCNALAREIDQQQRAPRIFVQVNIGDEDQKSGVAVGDLPALLATCRTTLGFAATGLMCIPPTGVAAEPYFRRLAELADTHGLAERSMGMSTDYCEAVRCGATTVRVGSALFGARPPVTPR